MRIYYSRETANEKEVKILGIRVYKKSLVHYKNRVWTKRKLLFGIFKTLENNDCKLYYFCGIKIFKKKPSLYLIIKRMENTLNAINRKNTVLENKIQTSITIANQHSKVFPQFKDKHKGQVIVLVGTGPSMLKYVPLKNAYHFGVNTSYQNKNINLDYYLVMDKVPIAPYLDEVQKLKMTKFIGQVYQPFPYAYYDKWDAHISNSFIENCENAYKYYVEQTNYRNINIDIETQMLPDLGSCIFQAAYISLYMGFKKIYLVGCDASANGHFNGDFQAPNSLVHNLPKSWASFKKYAQAFYPDVEIISINPVGLKGLFTDIYTTDNGSYVDSDGNEIKELTFI